MFKKNIKNIKEASLPLVSWQNEFLYFLRCRFGREVSINELIKLSGLLTLSPSLTIQRSFLDSKYIIDNIAGVSSKEELIGKQLQQSNIESCITEFINLFRQKPIDVFYQEYCLDSRIILLTEHYVLYLVESLFDKISPDNRVKVIETQSRKIIDYYLNFYDKEGNLTHNLFIRRQQELRKLVEDNKDFFLQKYDCDFRDLKKTDFHDALQSLGASDGSQVIDCLWYEMRDDTKAPST